MVSLLPDPSVFAEAIERLLPRLGADMGRTPRHPHPAGRNRDLPHGFLVPLFSAASTSSWGIGELKDIGPWRSGSRAADAIA